MGTFPAFSQKAERQNLRSGNKHYEKEEYAEAEADYRKALEANSKSIKSYYNTGNALYRQLKPEANKEIPEEEKKRMTDAVESYKTVTKLSENKEEKAMAWHNMGNIFMLTGDYQQSVDAYKNSLLNNPNDHETRYNYILAKELLKNQQNQQQPQQNQDNKDQNKDQNQNQQNQDNQDKKDQDQQQNPQQQQNRMSQENAEQILNAIKQQEQETQEKRQQAQPQQQQQRPEKDW